MWLNSPSLIFCERNIQPVYHCASSMVKMWGTTDFLPVKPVKKIGNPWEDRANHMSHR